MTRMMLSAIFTIFILSLSTVSCLYEDQTGRFDWRQQYVGKVKFMKFDQCAGQSACKRIIVASEENVIAALNAKTGEIAWRHILEKGENGHIDDVLVQDGNLIIVQAGGAIVRCINALMGTLVWEYGTPPIEGLGAKLLISRNEDNKQLVFLAGNKVLAVDMQGESRWFKALPNSQTVSFVHVAESGGNVVAIGVSEGSHVTMVTLQPDGTQVSEVTVPAAWISRTMPCRAVGDSHFVCLDTRGSILQTIDLRQPSQFKATPLTSLGLSANTASLVELRPVDTLTDPVLGLRMGTSDAAIVTIRNGDVTVMKNLPGASVVDVASFGEKAVVLSLSRTDAETLKFQVHDLVTGDPLPDLVHSVHYPAHHGLPTRLHAVLKKKDLSTNVRALVLAEDHSLLLFQQNGHVSWTREEALSGVLAVEMVDLPVPPIMAKMEEEFGPAGKHDLIGMFIQRFTTQALQLKDYLLQLKTQLRAPRHGHVGEEEEGEGEEQDEYYLTRDEFNIHKMIVVVTKIGKIYGIDSYKGAILWQQYLRDLTPFAKDGTETLPMFVQRTTAHFPHHPQISVLGRNRVTGQPLFYTFHPISGQPVEDMPSEGVTLNFDLLQAGLMAQTDDHFVRPVIMLDGNLKYHVFPESARGLVREMAASFYIFTTESSTGTVSGYSMLAGPDKTLVAERLWNLQLYQDDQSITNVVAKRALEHVHSQGIVLGDRSVLYKYLNPNMVVITTEGTEASQKASDGTGKPSSFLSVYLVDVVSGQLVFHCTHKKARGPIHVVHSENWVVYDYWNQKHRRSEMAVLELYEGKRQSNATAFSSLFPPPTPLVMRQAYVFSGHVTAMQVSLTEKGITNKHVLMALETGGILEMPKALLDPRRPENPTQQHREEGILPYIPELPRQNEMTINYHQAVYNIRGIYTAPAGLESTSLVLCHGLDLFYSKVMPSKMFDVLKEDFDYFFIGMVLFGMIAVSVITQKLASRKALNRAWK